MRLDDYEGPESSQQPPAPSAVQDFDTWKANRRQPRQLPPAGPDEVEESKPRKRRPSFTVPPMFVAVVGAMAIFALVLLLGNRMLSTVRPLARGSSPVTTARPTGTATITPAPLLAGYTALPARIEGAGWVPFGGERFSLGSPDGSGHVRSYHFGGERQASMCRIALDPGPDKTVAQPWVPCAAIGEADEPTPEPPPPPPPLPTPVPVVCQDYTISVQGGAGVGDQSVVGHGCAPTKAGALAAAQADAQAKWDSAHPAPPTPDWNATAQAATAASDAFWKRKTEEAATSVPANTIR